jgi:hypothetical protein
MLRTAMLLMLLVSAKGTDARVEAVVCNSTFSAAAWDLLARGRFGRASTERAAFVVAAASGDVTLVEWPFQSKFQRASYDGVIPAGTIGIVHTHPNSCPNPSAGDSELARRMGMPVLVLTRTVISWTDGARTGSMWLGPWTVDDGPATRCGAKTTAVASLR